MNRVFANQAVRYGRAQLRSDWLTVHGLYGRGPQLHCRFTHRAHKRFTTYSGTRNVLYMVAVGVGTFSAGFSLKNYVLCDTTEVLTDRTERTLSDVISESQALIQQVKDEMGCPGVAVGVSVDGKDIWSEGFGYADLENRVPCQADSVMRVASISKSITMTMVAKHWERGTLDLDRPVREYVKAWPHKTYQDEKVSVTTRQLVSHLSGVRHYSRDCGRKDTKTSKPDGVNKKEQKERKTELDQKEYHIKDKYSTMADSLKLFSEDDLCHKPGLRLWKSEECEK